MSSSVLARVHPQVRVTVPHSDSEAVLPAPSSGSAGRLREKPAAQAGAGAGQGVRTEAPLPGASRKGSRNGLTHGLTSREAVIRGEDPAAFEAYCADLVAEMRPVGTREVDLLETMVMAQWKLRRLWRGEVRACGKLSPGAESQAQVILDHFHGARRYASLTAHEAHLMRAYLRAESRLRLLQDLRLKGLRDAEVEDVEAQPAADAAQEASRDCPTSSAAAASAAADPPASVGAHRDAPPPKAPATPSTGWQDLKSGEITNQAVAEEMPRRAGAGSAGQGVPMAPD